MKRREFIASVGGIAAAVWPHAVRAQQPAKVARIGFIASNLSANPHITEALRHGLRDLGWTEGHSIVIEYRDGQGRLDTLAGLAAELVGLKVDVIVVASTAAALAAQNATKTIPIVFTTVPDPVASGLVASLAQPGGNLTGLSNQIADLIGKNLSIIKQTVPNAAKVAVLWQPGSYGENTEKKVLEAAEMAARALGTQLYLAGARAPADIDGAFAAMVSARADAITIITSGMLLGARDRIIELAAKNRLPAVYASREFADAGGLMSYGSNFVDMTRRAATYVDKILKGAKPADLPVQQPTKFELVLNLKTANALGITVPPTLLAIADQVIE